MNLSIKTLLAAGTIAAMATAANADVITSWVTTGLVGNETSLAPSASAANVTGMDLTRGTGLNPTSAANSFSSNGFNGADPTDYLSFGFTVNSGTVDLATLYIGTRSSGTGPGTIGLYWSGDSFASPLATIIQNNTAYENSVIDLSALTGLTGVVEFRLYEIGDTQADGVGDTTSTGTFRITNYFAPGDTGTIDTGSFRLESVTAPEPASLALLALGGLTMITRRRKA